MLLLHFSHQSPPSSIILSYIRIAYSMHMYIIFYGFGVLGFWGFGVLGFLGFLGVLAGAFGGIEAKTPKPQNPKTLKP